MTGPKGPTSYGTGGSRRDTLTKGSYYSLEWRMCCMWYFGELTKHLCLPFVCYVFQVPVMIAGRGRHDQYTLADDMFLRSWDMDYVLCFCENIGYMILG